MREGKDYHDPVSLRINYKSWFFSSTKISSFNVLPHRCHRSSRGSVILPPPPIYCLGRIRSPGSLGKWAGQITHNKSAYAGANQTKVFLTRDGKYCNTVRTLTIATIDTSQAQGSYQDQLYLGLAQWSHQEPNALMSAICVNAGKRKNA